MDYIASLIKTRIDLIQLPVMLESRDKFKLTIDRYYEILTFPAYKPRLNLIELIFRIPCQYPSAKIKKQYIPDYDYIFHFELFL